MSCVTCEPKSTIRILSVMRYPQANLRLRSLAMGLRGKARHGGGKLRPGIANLLDRRAGEFLHIGADRLPAHRLVEEARGIARHHPQQRRLEIALDQLGE